MTAPDPIALTADEQAKRTAVMAALNDAAKKGKLNIAALLHGMDEGRLAVCIRHQSLGTLSQAEIDWLAVDLRN